ncbi:MAG TPA: lysophospholipid acyltransferase family protein [Steroidobacteraceae bacterium]|nr:lysophospholipid acyltransferase family protein [Steroidobacteraceae bacterium]
MPERSSDTGALPRTLPEPGALRWRYALARLAFALAYRVLGLRRGVIRGNLERSFPALDAAARRRVARDFVARQSQVFAEIDYARQLSEDELRERVRLLDPAGVLAPAQAGERRFDVFIGGHQCNFEWLLLRLSLELGAGMVALYKPLRNARAEDYFRSRRTRFGARLLPAKSVTRELGTIRGARALGMIADQVPRTSPERHWTTFLRQPTAFFKGPERLARALRGRIVFVSMRRLARGRYEIELEPLTSVGARLPDGEATERYARVLERDIEADPAGWWWSHKRWKLQAPEEVSSG